jgi:hypothetical protein
MVPGRFNRSDQGLGCPELTHVGLEKKIVLPKFNCCPHVVGAGWFLYSLLWRVSKQ